MMGTDVAQPLRTRSSLGWDAARLRAALYEAIPATQGLLLSVPAPIVDGVVALRLANASPSFYWRPAAPAATVVGWDAALVINTRGPERFAEARVQAHAALRALHRAALQPDGELLSHAAATSTGAVTSTSPRVFGGFAFQPGATDHAIWQGFHDASLILPRFRYVLHEATAELAVTLSASELWNERSCELWLNRLQHAHAALVDLASRGSPPPTSARPSTSAQARRTSSTQTSSTQWISHIDQILRAIQTNQCSKVVLARHDHRAFERSLSVAETLAALQARSGAETTCFAFDFGDGAFVGATPETLISKVGASLTSEALAGSVGAMDPDGEHTLLESVKDREEHRVVVQAIVDILKPLCSTVSFAREPQLRRLRHLLHLWTPISAQLSAPQHVLDLVARLHPTPAVGGTPTDWAVRWITANETVPRGWYASPVGWFDAEGDGSFHVALRSGVLRGRDAFLYAGSGVVAKSDATSELAETELKLASLLDALRVE